MFKNLFSFDGRIRRLEYGLSFIIYIMCAFLIGVAIGILNLIGLLKSTEGPEANMITLVLFIPVIWFLLAQGAKRCHYLGKSGWWIIVPFYGFLMLFVDGDRYENEYGVNPKYPEENNNNPDNDPFGHFTKESIVQVEQTTNEAQPIGDVDGDGNIKDQTTADDVLKDASDTIEKNDNQDNLNRTN